MKKLYVAVLLVFTSAMVKSQGYQVTLRTPNFKSGIVYLTYYYGNSLNVEDSAAISNEGVAIFQKNQRLLPGVYSIVFPGKSKSADFLVGKEQKIIIKADTTDLVNKVQVTGSKENELFFQYERYIASKGKLLQEAQAGFNASRTKADSAYYEKSYSQLNKELNIYRENIMKQYPESMLATLFKGIKEIPLPVTRPVTKEDSLTNYNYYKKHYWDGINFMDDRVIRTPFFLPKLENYFRNTLVQSPDTVIKAADYLLLLARTNPEMYKFLLNWLTDEYINPKFMGLDAVFVHLYEKYHSQGVSFWLNENQKSMIIRRANMLMANLIGDKAADIQMIDTSGKPVSLYQTNATYTIVVFWDPTCSHCKEEVPRMDSLYQKVWKNEGVKVFGVLTENEKSKWTSFIREHNLKDWIHVYQTEEMRTAEVNSQKPGFRQLFDVTQTPTLYLLDKDKRIIAKKLTLEQLNDVLQLRVKNNKPS